MTLKMLYENNGNTLGIQFPEQPVNFSGRWTLIFQNSRQKRWYSCFVVHRTKKDLLSQRFYNYLAGSTDFGNVSFVLPGIHPFFYIGTDAFNHTPEYTDAAGRVNAIRWFQPSSPSRSLGLSMSSLFTLYSSAHFFFCARSWKGPVVHPEDSQSPSYDSCGCSLLPCVAKAVERGLQAGQTEPANISKLKAVMQPW